MKIYTIIGGINGSGKSSLTGVLKKSMDDLGIIIDVDAITLKAGKDPIEGGKAAIAIIKNCLSRGISFTQETTLSGYMVERTARKAKSQSYYIRLYYVGLDTPEEHIERIKNRVSKGGHNISDEDVLRRFRSRFYSLSKILPYCNEAAFFDNYNGFVQVAEYRNGAIVPIVEERQLWLKQLIQSHAEYYNNGISSLY